ncbi:coil containing protein [Vibrio phage 1.215.B._10N.222.54.F7]|nr:TMhelix containing protein [Vibrio phage 1.215.A._10N.222.54.F7]AUR96038.1 coil containing protein [Vibrio phage 1.215.B._10N.222.54.F7]
MAGVNADIEAKSAQGWVIKIIAFVISMCFIGVCIWVTTTTFKNDTQVQLMNQKFESALLVSQANTTDLTNKLVGVVDQLSDVSENLATISANLYTKDEAAKEAQRVNAELNNLRLQQAHLQGSIDFKPPQLRYNSNEQRTQ